MIKITPKPIKEVKTYEGTLEMDYVYGFIVEQTILDVKDPSHEPYYVAEIWRESEPDYEIDQSVVSCLEEGIKNYLLKNGI